MAIRVAIQHITHYRYDREVSLSPHVVRLRPAAHTRTPIKAYTLRVRPEKHFINWQQDPFGNYLARLVFPEKTRELYVEVEVIADLTVINPFDFFIEDYAQQVPFSYDEQTLKELKPYLEITEHGPLLTQWLAGVDCSKVDTNDFLVALNQRLCKDIGYNIRLEPGVQTGEETLTKKRGSCRDTSWLLVQILRHLGFAARFVSGYLVQLTADVKSLDGPSGPAQDFTDLHAWAEVYVPGAGWIGLDPTSGLFASEGHIPLACTPHPVSAAPITGATDLCETEFEHRNIVTRIHEDPRVTKPYTDEQWQTVLALGRQVDADLTAGDVRLTMGGEPTFVSIDDMDGAEWTTAALGPRKRRLAGELLTRLRTQFAPGGVLHYGQGKWYPGEPLPRWALGCFWRKDNVPIWRDVRWLSTSAESDGATQQDAQRFAAELAHHLAVAALNVTPAYEDTLYHLWKESAVPINLDPLKASLTDSLERRTLASVLSRGLDQPAGYLLPLQWNDANQRWGSGAWTFRRDRLYLSPGNSPMGLRLPLEQLPWLADDQRDAAHEQSLFAPLPALGDQFGEVTRRYSQVTHADAFHLEIQEQTAADAAQHAPSEIPRTALCVQERDGKLFVFLPPLTHLEHYLDLIASIEATAAKLELPVVLEGYEPPRDYRMQRLLVTPDPGVIEVNIHPAASWDEIVNNTEVLYEAAQLSRLGTEKFMLDGRHTGTGGGNHITIGAASPADSPVLRRPDLLRSLVTYWQHHPGLSYLFSGMFIGPTSQAPRVDEARDELLYELEVAFAQIPQGDVPQPWLVDRILRNLLVDLTGNTHRSEFCIDKLYSPDSATGRLGLVEFRAFEMPPHARMSVVQQLLLRALIARFWKQPYTHKLVRWGTALHDKFMLPHYVWADICEIVDELRAAGYPFQAEWFAPFLEFRFPHYGSVKLGDIELELRMALEPWPVLGEEVTQMGTARYVDSSVERVQIKASGLTDSRYVVTCNGRRVPLRSTGTHGEYVAGVRYKAWQPPSALHPTIGAHPPLVFDLVDTWNGRSIGGCTYHVSHPGGRHFDDFPVNSYVAETRRISRFWEYGHTPGVIEPPPELTGLNRFYPHGHPPAPMAPPREEVHPEYPHTLDLRSVAT